MLRKLALEATLGRDGPTVYADADVLFLPGARRLADLVGARSAPAWYLRDCEPYLDERVLTPAEAALAPVNGGFQVLLEPLDWTDALARLPADPVFHTEQTLLHLAMHGSGARALDPALYVVSTDDLRAWGDAFAGRPIALRHYTTPVRHKLWQAVGRGWARGAAQAAATAASSSTRRMRLLDTPPRAPRPWANWLTRSSSSIQGISRRGSASGRPRGQLSSRRR